MQNRVDPRGQLFRTSARGTLMGNRGVLHNDRREIVRRFKLQAWIACLLEFKGRHRKVMSPGRYTELFFLDEAVAFAAGHRPCAECRRERYNAFRAAWPGAVRSAGEMDAALHRARIDDAGRQVTFEAPLDGLPDGTFVRLAGADYLVHASWLLRWSPEGYTGREPRPAGIAATVLTPEPIVRCFQAGYRAAIHPSSG